MQVGHSTELIRVVVIGDFIGRPSLHGLAGVRTAIQKCRRHCARNSTTKKGQPKPPSPQVSSHAKWGGTGSLLQSTRVSGVASRPLSCLRRTVGPSILPIIIPITELAWHPSSAIYASPARRRCGLQTNKARPSGFPNCAHSRPLLRQNILACIIRGDVMTYDSDSLLELQFDAHLRQQRRSGRPPSADQQIITKIDMVIGSWHLDEFGNQTREIMARD